MIAIALVLTLSLQGTISILQSVDKFLDANPDSMILRCNFSECNKKLIADIISYNSTNLSCGIIYCDVTPNQCSPLSYAEIYFYSSKTLVYKTVADIEFSGLLEKICRLSTITDEGFTKSDKTKIAVVNLSAHIIRKLAFLPFIEIVDFSPKPIIFLGNHTGKKEIIHINGTYNGTIDREYTCILLSSYAQCPEVTSRFIYVENPQLIAVYRPLSKKLFVTNSLDFNLIQSTARPPIYTYPYPDESLTYITQDIMLFTYNNSLTNAKVIQAVNAWAKNVIAKIGFNPNNRHPAKQSQTASYH